MVSGGIEAIVCGLVNEQSKTEDVTLCTIFEPHKDDVFYNQVSERVRKITIGKEEFGFSIGEIFKIYNVIKTGGYDVVHVHGCFQYYFLAMLLLHRKVKFYYTIHSDAKKENQTWDWRLFKLKRFLFSHRWVVPVTISKSSQESFYSLYHCDSELIYNGTPRPIIKGDLFETNIYRITEKTKLFIHAGRISKPKNQLVLCRVFERLISEGKDVVLLIAGTPEEKNIYESIKSFFSDRIVYLGELNNIPSWFDQADAFCLPSIWEGLPVTLLEALSVGCIPICSPVGGIKDVIKDGTNGILSKSSSESDYYDAVSRFLSLNKEELKEMKKESLKTFESYNIEGTAKQYLCLYKNEG